MTGKEQLMTMTKTEKEMLPYLRRHIKKTALRLRLYNKVPEQVMAQSLRLLREYSKGQLTTFVTVYQDLTYKKRNNGGQPERCRKKSRS